MAINLHVLTQNRTLLQIWSCICIYMYAYIHTATDHGNLEAGDNTATALLGIDRPLREFLHHPHHLHGRSDIGHTLCPTHCEVAAQVTMVMGSVSGYETQDLISQLFSGQLALSQLDATLHDMYVKVPQLLKKLIISHLATYIYVHVYTYMYVH